MPTSSWPGSVKSQKPLALAHEKLDAKLVLEILDVLGDAGLGRKERVGNFGQIEVAPHRLADDPELLKVHSACSFMCDRGKRSGGGC